MASSIEDLYQQYAGRASDPGGLEYWTNQFGSEIDPTETATFQRAVAEGAAKGLESNVPVASYNPYFATNPDVAAAYTQNTYGLTPEQFAQTHYQQYGANEGRSAPVGALAQVTQNPPSDYVSPSSIRGGDTGYTDTSTNLSGDTNQAAAASPLTLTYHTGKTYEADALYNLAKELAGATSQGALQGGVYGEVGGNIGFAAEEAKKIFGDNTSAVAQVYLDAAANLLDKGVTGLSQLKYGDISDKANVIAERDDEGRITGYRAIYGNDGEGNPIFSRSLTPEEAAQVKTIQTETEDGSYTSYEPITTVVGKGIVGPDGRTVSDSSQLSIGQTYTGPGGTFYTLTFDPSTGKPAFSTQGRSSSDIGKIAPILSVLSFVPGPVGIAARVANAAIAVDQGNPLSALATFANIPGVGDVIPGSFTSALTTANQINSAVNALDRGDLMGLVNAGVGLSGAGGTQIGDTGFTVGDALRTANLAKAVSTGSPDAISSAISLALNANKAGTTGGGITNRTYDDTIVQAGADAFIRAKQAGADDDTAYAAANAVTGTDVKAATTVQPPAGGFDLGEFAGVDEAVQRNTAADAARANALQTISSQPKFSDAFAQARELLGPGQTFEWNGKQYSTATFAERPDLSGNVVPGAASTTAGGGRGSYAGYDAAADAAAKGAPKTVETAQQAAQETGFWQNLSNSLSNQMKLSSQAANDYLKNNPNSPITNNVSTALEAAGELIKNVGGGTALALDNKPLSDAFVKGGGDLMKLGQSIGTGPQDTKNWNETLSLVDKAKGWEKLGVIAGRIMDGTSGLARQAEVELRQELPALFLGGGSAKGILVASGLVDTADTGGSAVLDGYQDVIDKGGTHQEALAAGRKAGTAAAAAEAVIQATIGKLGDLAVGKLDNIIAKGTGRVAGEGLTEAGQEGSSSIAQDIVLGRDIDVNKALTQSVIGGAVGKTTSATTSPVSAAQDVGTTSEAIGAMNTNISTALSSGDKAAAGPVITESIFTAIGNGADAATAAGSAVGVALENGADLSPTVNAAVNASLSEDASNAPQVAESIISSVVASNGDVNQAADFVMDALIDSGMNFEQASKISADAVTKVTSDANINTQTTVNPDTNVTTTVTTNANTNVTTETKTDPNTSTKTTVTTDANNNTQKTVVVDTQTGEIIDEVVTSIPDGYTPPVIGGGMPTGAAAAATAAATKSAQPKVKLPSRAGAAGLAGGIGAMLPSSNDIDPALLPSRETQKAIDPLQRVMEAQAELENTAMMQQIDPRLLSVLQQRMAPEQQATQQQQFDKDIGALAKLLSGESESASNDQGYYSYGSEDSIDSILRGRAANFKEGGYVAPLMAEGGMALPLLAKSGGALDHYNGRENFKDGKHVAGEGDGQSDDIPAWLADGEFVFPADVVSALGNGSTKAGTDKLYEMMHSIRDRARSKGPKDLPPPALKSPLDYLKSRKRSQ